MALPGDLVAANLRHYYLDWTGRAITLQGKEQRDMYSKKKPSTIKWKKGILGPTIRNQRLDNICWAIAIALATEAIKNLDLRKQDEDDGEEVWVASPQELIDHVEEKVQSKDKMKNHSLMRMSAAWDYIKNSHLSQEGDYPFEEPLWPGDPKKPPRIIPKKGIEVQDVSRLLWIRDYVEREPVNEIELLARLHVQPVVVSIESTVAFGYWDGVGIFNGGGSMERLFDLGILNELKPKEPEAVVEIKGKGKATAIQLQRALDNRRQKLEEMGNVDELKAEDIPELAAKMKQQARDGSVLQQHAVLLVGYGTSKRGTNFFLFQNSHGPEWGIQGLGKIIRACSGRGQRNSLLKTFSYPYLEE